MTGLFSYPKRKLRKMVKNGDYREALAFGESIEERFSADSDFLFIMGSIYYILENGDNALHYFERALAINDSDTETLALKASLHYTRGEAAEARACCERIVEIDPDHMASRDMLRDLDEVDEALAAGDGSDDDDDDDDAKPSPGSNPGRNGGPGGLDRRDG